MRPLQALTLASALTFGTPFLAACSSPSRPSEELMTATTGSARPVSSLPPTLPPPRAIGSSEILAGDARTVLESRGLSISPSTPVIVVRGSESGNTSNNALFALLSLCTALGALGTALLTHQHLKLRKEQAYAANRASGLTLEEDIRQIEKRMNQSAGDRDHWHREFLTDLGKVAKNGLLRPARCREEHILDLMNLRKRNLPVISTVVAPPGAGKSRMAEGLVHTLYHDRDGNHYTSSAYNPRNRLFPDINPETLLAYRLNLGQLTHVDAEPMFHLLMQKADQCAKAGGRCLVIIDEVQYLYKPNGHASAARLIHLIRGWTDGQMQHNKGIWGIALAPDKQYSKHIFKQSDRRRRFEAYEMPILSGGPLRLLIDEIVGEWEAKSGVRTPPDVRDRAVELMGHPANDMANPYAVLNLMDRVQANMGPGETMTSKDLERSFAHLHRIPEGELAKWVLYPLIQESIARELKDRFDFLEEEAPGLFRSMVNGILEAWKRSDQSFSRTPNNEEGESRLFIQEAFIEKMLLDIYVEIEGQNLRTNLAAHELMRKMREKDKGPRIHRGTNVARFPTAPDMGRRQAANA